MNKLKKTLDNLNIKKINNILNVSSKILKILYFLLIVVAIYVIVLILKEWNVISILLGVLKIVSPLFIGFILAWLLNPLVTRLTDRGMKRTPSVILVFSLVVLFIYFFCLLIIPVVANQINEIVAAIPGFINDIKNLVNSIFDKFSNMSLTNLDNVKENFFEKMSEVGSSISVNLPEMFIAFIKSVVSALGVIIISLVIGFYMLFNFDKVKENLIKLLPKKYRKETRTLMDSISSNLYEYVNGMLLVSLIIFIVNTIGFSIIGLSAPLLFGLFCGITNLIPYVGPYIGGAPAVLVGYSISPLVGTLILIFIIVVQTLEGTFITPLVMSKKMNLSPITIIIALLIFGYLFGIIGMIIATPIVAILKIIYTFLDKKYDFFEYENDDKEKSKVDKV